MFFLLINTLLFAETRIIKLVTDDNFLPYANVVNGKVIGYDVDIIREIGKRLDIIFEIEALPFKRVLYMIEIGIVDGGFTLFKTDIRKSWCFYTKYPIHKSRYNLFTRKGNEFKFNEVSDLIGKKIGINFGFSINAEFDRMKESGEITVIESEDSDLNFKLLKNGRIDRYIGNYFTSHYKININESEDDFSMLPVDIVHGRDSFLVFSRRSKLDNIDSLISVINGILEELYQDGTIDKISQMYLGR